MVDSARPYRAGPPAYKYIPACPAACTTEGLPPPSRM